MSSILKWNPFSQLRKSAYHLVNDSSDQDSVEYSQKENQLILKLGRQIKLLGVCCILLLSILLLQIARDVFHPASPTSSLLQNFNPKNLVLAPEFPLVTKVFEPGPKITEITPEIEKRWEADMPRGRGFVHVPTGRNDSAEDIYVVSVYHQLHCLYMMQKSFTRAMENSSQLDTFEVHHTYHCAELLRQGLKCAADPTLDTTVIRNDVTTKHATSGWYGTHVCRDYDSLFAWTEEHRTNDRVGAGILAGHHSENDGHGHGHGH